MTLMGIGSRKEHRIGSIERFIGAMLARGIVLVTM